MRRIFILVVGIVVFIYYLNPQLWEYYNWHRYIDPYYIKQCLGPWNYLDIGVYNILPIPISIITLGLVQRRMSWEWATISGILIGAAGVFLHYVGLSGIIVCFLAFILSFLIAYGR